MGSANATPDMAHAPLQQVMAPILTGSLLTVGVVVTVAEGMAVELSFSSPQANNRGVIKTKTSKIAANLYPDLLFLFQTISTPPLSFNTVRLKPRMILEEMDAN
jgi:hypothetical protein